MPIAAGSYPYPGAPSAPTGEIIRPTVPEDYQRIEARPEMFGAQVGAQQERLGQIGMQASEEFTQRAIARQQFQNANDAQNAQNRWAQRTQALLFGDPSNPSAPPGIYQLKGDDAIARGRTIGQDLDRVVDEEATGLNAPARLQFLGEVRRLRFYENGNILRHLDQQQFVVGAAIQKAAEDQSQRDAALYWNNDDKLSEALEKGRDAATKRAQAVSGFSATPEVLQDARTTSDANIIESAATAALAAGDSIRARAIIDAHPGVLKGGQLDRLNNQFNAAEARAQRAATKAAIADATRAIIGGGSYTEGAAGGAFRAPPGPRFFNAPIEGANPAEQQMLNEIRYREPNAKTAAAYTEVNPDSGAGGAYQFLDTTWKENTKKAGIGTEYAKAVDAPPKVQDAVALWTLRNQGTIPWKESGPYPALGAGGVGLQADFAKRSGEFGTPEEAAKHLTTVTTPGGATFRVHEKAAAQVQGFVNELEGMGYKIDPAHSSGYNNRNKVGVNTDEKSEHAYGTAFDVNDDRNKQDDKLVTDLPSNIGQIAAKWGLKWGGDFEGKKDAMHFEVARLLPGGGPDVRIASAAAAPTSIVPAAYSGAPVAQPIPTAPQPTPAAPVDKLRPDFESMEERAYTIENEDVRRGVLANLQRAKSQWSLATATDRKQTVQDVNNTIRQRMIGQDVPDIDEKRIRHLFPQEQADDMLEKMGDAKIYGDTLNRVNTQTLSEITNERARLAAARGVPGIHDIQVRAQGATDYEKVSEAVIKGMQADPAAQMASRPELRDLATALGQLQPPATDADLPAYQQAHEHYANSMLAAQQTWGLPTERSHVLSVTEAQGLAGQLTADPAGAPKLMAGMEREWGSAWSSVWHDLVSLGKLPAEFQAVGIIDAHNAMRLAQGLRDEQGGEGEKEKGTAVWDKLFGAQVVSGTTGVIPTVRGDPRITQFLLSMNSGGATGPEMDGVLHVVDTLAFSLMAHEPGMAGVPGKTQAIETAINALTGLYEYMPNGGARVPKAQYDNVTRAATATIAELTPDWVRIPQGFSGTHGEPTTADYIAALKGSPVWINGHEGIDLIDNGGRRVLGRDGKPMHIPFDVPAQPAGPVDLGAGYAVPIPPM